MGQRFQAVEAQMGSIGTCFQQKVVEVETELSGKLKVLDTTTYGRIGDLETTL